MGGWVAVEKVEGGTMVTNEDKGVDKWSISLIGR